MKQILFLFTVVFCLAWEATTAQILITKNDSVPILNNKGIKLILPEHRGNVQWQKSLDNTNWISIPGANSDTLTVPSNQEALNRVAITDGNCLPVYSDSAAVLIRDSVNTNVVIPGSNGWKLVSDSAAISKGVYTYTQTGSGAGFEVGKVIVDEESGGTIRRITSISQKPDTVSLTTTQASMEDVFRNISFKLSTNMIYPQINLKSASPEALSKALTDEKGYIHPVEVIYLSDNGEKIKSASVFDKNDNAETGTLYVHKSWSNLKMWDFPPGSTFTLKDESGTSITYTGGAKAYITEGYSTFDPLLLFDFDFKSPEFDWDNLTLKKGEVKKFVFEGSALIDFKNIIDFNGDLQYSLGQEFTLMENLILVKLKYLVGIVPVWIDVKTDLKCGVSASFSSGPHRDGFQKTINLSFGINYKDGDWLPLEFDADYTHQVFDSPNVSTTKKLKFSIYPSTEAKIYSCAGPF